ncbi:MAG: DUF6169 family protein [Cytophagales bacterium]|nr:DUF6169 family protein [Cytophagales bacterium]
MARPYNFIETGDRFYFSTDSQIIYYAVFTKGEGLYDEPHPLNELTYYFSFAPIGRVDDRLGTDYRIRATIISIIEHYLKNNPEKVVFYVCSNQKYADYSRFRLFTRWKKYGATNRFEHISKEITVTTVGVKTDAMFVGMILNRDSPYFDELIPAFHDRIDFLSLKWSV